MAKSRFSGAEIVSVLKQNELGATPAVLCRRYGISEQTFYRWRKQYGGMSGGELRRLKELEAENTRLSGSVRI